jgi:DNA-directed RNA polymerase specialized sigma24 family protein
MNESASPRKSWDLSHEAFHKLLACLDPDPNQAGEKYETLRGLLVKFFDWRGASYPEECADETFDRVARKVAEGETVRDVTNYCYGVARLVFLETLKGPEHQFTPLDDVEPVAAIEDRDDTDQQQECFDGCLYRLPVDSRKMILQYYQDERQAKIDHRKALADQLGIPMMALRNRAQRARNKLEECVSECLKKN